MPSYRFYKFCLSGWITVPLMIYSFFYLAFIPLDLPWWAALIIGFLCTIVCLFPLIAPLSPFVVCVVMLFGVILRSRVSRCSSIFCAAQQSSTSQETLSFSDSPRITPIFL